MHQIPMSPLTRSATILGFIARRASPETHRAIVVLLPTVSAYGIEIIHFEPSTRLLVSCLPMDLLTFGAAIIRHAALSTSKQPFALCWFSFAALSTTTGHER